MSESTEFLREIKDMLKYAAKNKNWGEILDVIEMINEELEINENLDYISREDDDEDEITEDYS